ncbi:aldo-keto reductase family 1 member B1-like [Sitodiplosis mosellana]|uniref:aldo-keto reductase family 1 member B1-like n=1 Tax=Sitodiplosis mosellana TaxID=263140 RepID=UPI002444F837|nr:aldo-keto reductase family 1 member B1-like [Sitodiplosis mosellana]
MANVPKILMNNGLFMPGFGLGTFESFGLAGRATKHAIDVGYRHFDTARLYANEVEVGQAIQEKIKEGVVKREEIFIVTKLWNTDHEPEKVEKAARQSCEKLGLGYIDLYLMHYPVAFKERTPFEDWPLNPDGTFEHVDVDYIDTWKAMEKLVDLGIVKSIGISNFNSQQIDRLLANCRIKPVNNQIEASPQINQKKLIKFCQERDIIVTAYCPLGRPIPAEKKPSFLYDDKLTAIAKKYNKTVPQVVFRYLIDIGSVPIPKSVTPKRIEENIDVFDFKLSTDEIKYIDTFNTGERVIHFTESRHDKHFPFNIEF